MKESKLMLIQYGTAVAAVALVSVHLLMQGVLTPYANAISFGTILSIYQSWVYALFLEALLVVVLVHGFNGVRIILHEWKQTRSWSTWVDIGVVLAILGSVGYGTRTIVLAVFGAGGS
jgi:succinate dehydrogenase / fumarate reductase, membrane anchor subunit